MKKDQAVQARELPASSAVRLTTAMQGSLFGQQQKTERTELRESENQSNRDLNSDLKPYPAYKDSGVPWLGRTPGRRAAEGQSGRRVLKDSQSVALQPAQEMSCSEGGLTCAADSMTMSSTV